MTLPSQTRLYGAIADALTYLEDAGCTFDLCPGPGARPEDMLSCRVCWAIWSLRRVVPHRTEIVRARNLDPDMILADGAVILRLSFQRVFVYASIVAGGHPRRRRYRYDQPVKIRQYT